MVRFLNYVPLPAYSFMCNFNSVSWAALHLFWVYWYQNSLRLSLSVPKQRPLLWKQRLQNPSTVLQTDTWFCPSFFNSLLMYVVQPVRNRELGWMRSHVAWCCSHNAMSNISFKKDIFWAVLGYLEHAYSNTEREGERERETVLVFIKTILTSLVIFQIVWQK